MKPPEDVDEEAEEPVVPPRMVSSSLGELVLKLGEIHAAEDEFKKKHKVYEAEKEAYDAAIEAAKATKRKPKKSRSKKTSPAKPNDLPAEPLPPTPPVRQHCLNFLDIPVADDLIEV